MEFKGPYMMAMREQAPKMFNQLTRSGELEAHVQEKSLEAHRMFKELTGHAPNLPTGYPRQPWAREAEDRARDPDRVPERPAERAERPPAKLPE